MSEKLAIVDFFPTKEHDEPKRKWAGIMGYADIRIGKADCCCCDSFWQQTVCAQSIVEFSGDAPATMRFSWRMTVQGSPNQGLLRRLDSDTCRSVGGAT